jgi:hypothetical protein
VQCSRLKRAELRPETHDYPGASGRRLWPLRPTHVSRCEPDPILAGVDKTSPRLESIFCTTDNRPTPRLSAQKGTVQGDHRRCNHNVAARGHPADSFPNPPRPIVEFGRTELLSPWRRTRPAPWETSVIAWQLSGQRPPAPGVHKNRSPHPRVRLHCVHTSVSHGTTLLSPIANLVRYS